LNEQKLQKLLKLKKLETPGKEYFDGFLDEFHRYQRAELFRKASRWEPLHAWLREIFIWEPRRSLAIGGSFAVVVVLLTLSLVNFEGNPIKDNRRASFAKTKVVPNANVQLVSDTENADASAPRYSTGQATLSYDKTIAF
jgi:hypothetical protein